jgi:hypothetical protein
MNDDDPVHHCNDCQWSNSKVHNDSLASSLAVGRALDLGILNLELLPAFVCFHSLPVLAMTSHSWNVPRLKRHVIHSFRRERFSPSNFNSENSTCHTQNPLLPCWCCCYLFAQYNILLLLSLLRSCPRLRPYLIMTQWPST